MAQLCVNRFDLPNELLMHIKDYALLSAIERRKIMEQKKSFHKALIDGRASSNESIYRTQAWIFWKKYEKRPIFLYCEFCKSCGNYVHNTTPAKCHC